MQPVQRVNLILGEALEMLMCYNSKSVEQILYAWGEQESVDGSSGFHKIMYQAVLNEIKLEKLLIMKNWGILPHLLLQNS